MRIISKRVAFVIAAAGLGTAVAAVPASAQTAQQLSQQLQQQQQQQAQQQQLQDQLRQQAEQQAQQQQQQQQAWQQQAAQQQQQQQWLQQQRQQEYAYGYYGYGGVNPTLLGLAFWTGKPYTYWACQFGVDFQCPATRAAARAPYTTAAPDAPTATPAHRHRARHVRHHANDQRAASR